MPRHLLFRNVACLFLVVFSITTAPAAGQYLNPPEKFEYYPGAQYDASIPTLKQVVGHENGAEITNHAQIEAYLNALVKAAPNHTRLARYAETWEGRPLWYLVIASEANIARLEEIKRGMQRLADPRGLSESDANKLIDSLPPVTWLAYGVHGNEISSCDAALLTAYHLLASRNDAITREILEKTVVIIDPTQNPDGRNRFIQYFTQSRGRWPNADPSAAEHTEVWPGGRANHYLFDMNRDWFASTQPETRGRQDAYLEWFPVVFVDLHEMGGNSTYYFAPPAQPYNPNLTPAQIELFKKYGQNNSEWFDKFRFDYFTRDVYDSFYPGYGEGWPLFQGSIGMTYEQASTRGLILDRDDKTQLQYRDGVHHHFISSISTAQTTARNAKEMLRYFYNFRRSAVEEGQKETVKEFILEPGRDPNRAAKFAALLMRQGIEVKRAEKAFFNARVRDYYEDKSQSRDFPAGTYIISLAQPAKRLAKTLLDKNTAVPKDFLEEQIRRRKKRLPEEFYDVTGWSLPLLYDVDMVMAEQASAGSFSVLKEAPKPQGRLTGGKAHLAYLIPWGTQSAAAAAADLLRQKVRLHRAGRPLTLGNSKFPAGTIIVKVKDNSEDLHTRIEKIVAEHGAEVFSTDRGWVDDGINLGSRYVEFVEPPRIALAWNDPTSSTSAGWTRYVLEQMYGVPVSVVRTQFLGFGDLSKYNVIILPSGGNYGGVLGEGGTRNLKSWVEAGGTLVTFGNATRWLTEERVGLLATTREFRSGKPEREEKPAAPASGATPSAPGAAPPAAGAPPASAQAQSAATAQKPAETKTVEATAQKQESDLEKMIQPDRELPDAVPGNLYRARVDGEHWLGFGYDGAANVMLDSNNLFIPLKLDRGTNVATFFPGDAAQLSGFNWEGTKKQVGNKAYLMHSRSGRGNVVAFAEDPNYRAFMDGLNVMLLNAVLFGPTYTGGGFGQ
jgi:hypothetical protein